ncbi:MAG: ATP-binding protein [Candidatus Gracilibacteria bacterium]
MISRHIAPFIRKAASQFPVLSVTGPRQSGKTTLVKKLFPHLEYVLLEEPEEREMALTDPKGFLNRFKKGAILDEVQRVPELFSSLMGVVDENQNKFFVLTGSQHFLLMNKISQSLAGRVGVIHLMPFGMDELKKAKRLPSSLEETLFTGFYPRIYDKKLDPQLWLKSYYQTYLERDVRTLTNVGDLNTFQRFVRLCAARSGQLLNLVSLATDAGISQPTAKHWLSMLETSFLVTLLKPHYRNFNKRLIKSPKLYFLDTGLLCYLLGIRDPEMLKIHSSRGAIFETLIVSEFYKYFIHQGMEPPLFFWRDHSGHEVDLLIDFNNETIPVEIKSGETLSSDSFKGIRYWFDLNKNSKPKGALIYAGEKRYLNQGIEIMPWNRMENLFHLISSK